MELQTLYMLDRVRNIIKVCDIYYMQITCNMIKLKNSLFANSLKCLFTSLNYNNFEYCCNL